MAVGVINTFPPNTELPPGSSPTGPVSLPGVTYVYAVLGLQQTWTAVQTFNSGMLALAGSISGSLTINAPPVASGIITFPIGTTNFSLTGGPSQVVKQTTVGGPFTVSQLTFSDISQTVQIITAGATVTVAASDSLIIINKSSGSATTVNLPAAASKTSPVKIVDYKGDSDVNPITINCNGAEKFNGNSGSWTISGQGASIVCTPIPTGGYAV